MATSTHRFWTRDQLRFERVSAQASERTVREALALYSTDPKPLTELDASRVDGLEEILRWHYGQAGVLKRSHHRPRRSARGRARCALRGGAR